MLRSKWMIILAVGFGLVGGLMSNSLLALRPSYAQEAESEMQGNRILIHGSGVANSSWRPPKENMAHHFGLYGPQFFFKIVPPGKRFVLTDIMLEDKGSVRQKITINMSDAIPQIERANILLQIPFEPGKYEQVHLCSGYVIGSGHALVAWTNAGIEPDQFVNISVTGYLEDDK
jgi:hypothetical protein